MAWIQFALSAVLTVVAANYLAKFADVISIRLQVGGLLIGSILLSGATSLPELLTGINAIQQEVPDLFVGNIYGSVMFNMLILALLDLSHRRRRVLRRVASTHAITAGLAVLLVTASTIFLLVEFDLKIAWVGLDSLLLIATYVVGIQIIRSQNRRPTVEVAAPPVQGLPSLRRAVIGFGVVAAVLILATPVLVSSTREIAEITGISTGFAGLLLVGIVTSLPETISTMSAVRIGAYDMAIGNLFGSNMFNIFALAITDFFFVQGSLLGAVENPMLVTSGLVGVVLTTVALIGNIARFEKRIWIFEIDAMIIIVVYVVSVLALYLRGVLV